VIGMLSDSYGRRPLLLLCLAGTFISFLMMAMSIENYYIVLASRILDGILGGNISLAQAYVSDLSPPGPERSKRLGFVMASYGLGFTIGPAIGGALGNAAGRAGPVWLASILTGANLIGVFFLLKESLPAEKRATAITLSNHPPATAVFKFLSRPFLGPLLILRFVNGFAFTCVVETAFGFFNQERLGLTARQSSYFMALIGLVYSLIQSRVGVIAERYGRRSLLRFTTMTAAAALALWAGANSVIVVVVVASVYAAASGAFNTVVYSLITQAVEQQSLGGTLGLSAAVGSLTRVIAPTASGALIEYLGASAPLLVCALLTLASYPLVAMSSNDTTPKSDDNDAHARSKPMQTRRAKSEPNKS